MPLRRDAEEERAQPGVLRGEEQHHRRHRRVGVPVGHRPVVRGAVRPALVGLGVAVEVGVGVGQADDEGRGGRDSALPGVRWRPASVASQNAARSRASRSARKSQPWLKPALGARTASATRSRTTSRGTATSGSNRRTMRRRRTASRSSIGTVCPPSGATGVVARWAPWRTSRCHRGTPCGGRPTSSCATAPWRTSGRSGPPTSAGIHRFHSAQSDESIYLRFFAPLRRLSDSDVHRFTHVDYVDRVALVVTMREDIIGIGRYDRIDPRSAEVAFNISDLYQGKGIGSVLLEHLAAIAREVGISRFTAEVLPQNRKMLAVFSDAGYDVTRHIEDGVVEVGFDIEPTDQSKAVAMSREHRAEALSVRSLLHPRTIAVIGASRRTASIGSQLLDRLVDAGFTGRIHPVNPNVRALRRRRAYPSVSDVPDQVDLAVVAVPAHAVLEVVDECAEAGREVAPRRVVGLRRGGQGGRAAAGRARATRTRRGDARRRAQLLRAHQQRPGGAAQRLARADAAAARPARAVRAVGRARHRGARLRGPAQPRHLDVRRRRATGSTCPATTSCSTGSTTTARMPSASTSSRWATRASSRGSPATSPSSSPSSS